MNKGDTYRQKLQKAESPAILQRIAGNDKSVINDCLDTYGNLIWALAKRYTSSAEEAEEAVLQIFKDIWESASQYDSAKGTEEKYILQLAFHRLIKQSSSGIIGKAICNRQSSTALPFYCSNDSGKQAIPAAGMNTSQKFN